jgi:hypothetical protein
VKSVSGMKRCNILSGWSGVGVAGSLTAEVRGRSGTQFQAHEPQYDAVFIVTYS